MTYHQLYFHFVWSTKNREPLLEDRFREDVHAIIWKKCRDLDCSPVVIGSVEDHVHLLVQMKPTLAPADLVRPIKGVSSRFITTEIFEDRKFQWQSSYGVFTISKTAIPKVRDYILNQREHHNQGTLIGDLEKSE